MKRKKQGNQRKKTKKNDFMLISLPSLHLFTNNNSTNDIFFDIEFLKNIKKLRNGSPSSILDLISR